MYSHWQHITKYVLTLLLFTVGCVWDTYASRPDTAKVGQTITLSVEQQGTDSYEWELYIAAPDINFARTPGNCPESRARFVNGKSTGHTVQVKWLKPGEYFYKITSLNSCTNNMKIGYINVSPAEIIPPPIISVSYDCERSVAILEAKDYTGNLRWSTGETKPIIEVKKEGKYSLLQTVDGVESDLVQVTIKDIVAKPPLTMPATAIVKGEEIRLIATKPYSTGGKIHWYEDKALTKELSDPVVSPETMKYYYAVYENEHGCLSTAKEVPIYVKESISECDKMFRELAQNYLITPNGDNLNEFWNMTDLRNYCKKCFKVGRVRIFNRWGAKVYDTTHKESENYKFNGFSDSHFDFNGNHQLPDGVYFYIITIEGKEKGITGYIKIAGSKQFTKNVNKSYNTTNY